MFGSALFSTIKRPGVDTPMPAPSNSTRTDEAIAPEFFESLWTLKVLDSTGKSSVSDCGHAVPRDSEFILSAFAWIKNHCARRTVRILRFRHLPNLGPRKPPRRIQRRFLPPRTAIPSTPSQIPTLEACVEEGRKYGLCQYAIRASHIQNRPIKFSRLEFSPFRTSYSAHETDGAREFKSTISIQPSS